MCVVCCVRVRSGACNDDDDEARDETEGRKEGSLLCRLSLLSSSIVGRSVSRHIWRARSKTTTTTTTTTRDDGLFTPGVSLTSSAHQPRHTGLRSAVLSVIAAVRERFENAAASVEHDDALPVPLLRREEISLTRILSLSLQERERGRSITRGLGNAVAAQETPRRKHGGPSLAQPEGWGGGEGSPAGWARATNSERPRENSGRSRSSSGECRQSVTAHEYKPARVCSFVASRSRDSPSTTTRNALREISTLLTRCVGLRGGTTNRLYPLSPTTTSKIPPSTLSVITTPSCHFGQRPGATRANGDNALTLFLSLISSRLDDDRARERRPPPPKHTTCVRSCVVAQPGERPTIARTPASRCDHRLLSASSISILKRPSARRGPGIVSVDRNVRSKCRCSCVLQFTS